MSLTRMKVILVAGSRPSRRGRCRAGQRGEQTARRWTGIGASGGDRRIGVMGALGTAAGPGRRGVLPRMQWPPLSRMLGAMNEALADRSRRRDRRLRPTRPPRRRSACCWSISARPDAADAPAVRRYLKEFLSDPRVIENQGLVWQARAQRHHPADPAAHQSPRLPEDLERRAQRIAAQDHHPRAGREARRRARRRSGRTIVVDWAMRYGNPSIASRLDGAGRARLRAHPGDPALSAILPPRPPRRSATRCSAC